jgi:hypothetical protein
VRLVTKKIRLLNNSTIGFVEETSQAVNYALTI